MTGSIGEDARPTASAPLLSGRPARATPHPPKSFINGKGRGFDVKALREHLRKQPERPILKGSTSQSTSTSGNRTQRGAGAASLLDAAAAALRESLSTQASMASQRRISGTNIARPNSRGERSFKSPARSQSGGVHSGSLSAHSAPIAPLHSPSPSLRAPSARAAAGSAAAAAWSSRPASCNPGSLSPQPFSDSALAQETSRSPGHQAALRRALQELPAGPSVPAPDGSCTADAEIAPVAEGGGTARTGAVLGPLPGAVWRRSQEAASKAAGWPHSAAGSGGGGGTERSSKHGAWARQVFEERGSAHSAPLPALLAGLGATDAPAEAAEAAGADGSAAAAALARAVQQRLRLASVDAASGATELDSMDGAELGHYASLAAAYSNPVSPTSPAAADDRGSASRLASAAAAANGTNSSDGAASATTAATAPDPDADGALVFDAGLARLRLQALRAAVDAREDIEYVQPRARGPASEGALTPQASRGIMRPLGRASADGSVCGGGRGASGRPVGRSSGVRARLGAWLASLGTKRARVAVDGRGRHSDGGGEEEEEGLVRVHRSRDSRIVYRQRLGLDGTAAPRGAGGSFVRATQSATAAVPSAGSAGGAGAAHALSLLRVEVSEVSSTAAAILDAAAAFAAARAADDVPVRDGVAGPAASARAALPARPLSAPRTPRSLAQPAGRRSSRFALQVMAAGNGSRDSDSRGGMPAGDGGWGAESPGSVRRSAPTISEAGVVLEAVWREGAASSDGEGDG